MGDRGPILRVWQNAFTELSTDSFKSNFGTHSTPMPRARYQEEGYQPPFETLPSEPDFLAAPQKAQNGAKRSTDREH